MPLADAISLILVRSAAGYCFKSWSRADGRLMPEVSEDLKQRVFPSEEAAFEFFRDLLPTLTS